MEASKHSRPWVWISIVQSGCSIDQPPGATAAMHISAAKVLFVITNTHTQLHAGSLFGSAATEAVRQSAWRPGNMHIYNCIRRENPPVFCV